MPTNFRSVDDETMATMLPEGHPLVAFTNHRSYVLNNMAIMQQKTLSEQAEQTTRAGTFLEGLVLHK
jgi:hypothetical protein